MPSESTTPLPPLLLDRRGVCAMLMMAERTFDRLRACRRFPPPDIELSERLIRWRRESVEKWIIEQPEAKAAERSGR